jgi:cobalt-zinc-cadmium efflux system membrane fusion protein
VGRRSVGLVAAVCLVLLAPACAKTGAPAVQAAAGDRDSIQLAANSPQLPFLKIETVVEASVGATIAVTGRVDFDEDRTQRVASPIDGHASGIRVRLGDRVTVNQPLIEITSPHVGELQAAAQKADQDLALAQKSLDRAHKLQEDNAVSEKELAQFETDYRKAKSDAESASTELRALGIKPTDPAIGASLRAQVAGTVVDRNVLLGQEVRADAALPLLTISDLDSVWVIGDLYEQDLNFVAQDAPVDVSVPAYPEQRFRGRVAYIGDVLDPTSHTVKLRCVVPNSNHLLKPEMFAKIAVSGAANAKVITIPTKAVLADDQHTRVIVNAGDKYKLREVTVGPEVEGRVRVLAGLTRGERIVTEGALFLKGEIDDQ